MHERERALFPVRHHRRERRMKSEEAVEVEDAVLAAAIADRDRRARLVIVGLAMRHNDVEAIDRAAQEDHHDALFAGVAFERAGRPRISAKKDHAGGREHGGAAEEFAATWLIFFAAIHRT